MFQHYASVSTIALSLGLCVPAHAIQESTPEPGQRYEVVDVAAGNTLNVRAQPSIAADIVAHLDSDARDIAVAGTRVKVNGSVWWQVIGPQELGWVNARYLAPADVHGEGERAFPLRCLGTEPFWTLTVNDRQATLDTPEKKAVWDAGGMTPAQGMTGRYAIRLESEEGVGHLAAWRNAGLCSDGMSEVGYPFEGIVAGPEGSVRAGCCMRVGG